jgi:membrane-bound lytic murein transglycosylase D
MYRHIIVAIFILHSICGVSQSFLQQQEWVFRQSESQWLVTELEKANKEHFACRPSHASWSLPNQDTLSFFQYKIEVPDSVRLGFQSLLFPGNECKRYLKLVSLCDLYFPLFRKKAESMQLSGDYQLLPLIMSGLNSNYKTSADRAGLWSIDYLAARKYGLRIDQYVDERRGGDFTTHAVVTYLSDLHKQYDGDAIKILTAYRKGAPYVALLMSMSDSLSFYDALDADSKSFIQFYAYVNQLIKSTRTENQLHHYFDIMGLYEGVFFEDELSMEALSKMLEVPEAALRVMNPVYTGERMEAGYRKVPFMIENTLMSRYHQRKDSIMVYETAVQAKAIETTVAPKYHVVKRGETLGGIAARYRVSVSDLKRWNKLRSDVIRQGQRLVVGQSAKTVAKPSSTEVKQPSTQKKEAAVKQNVDKANVTSKEDKITYTVKNGDSLWKIAKRYKGVTENDIKKWNNIGDNIRPGQKLIIYTK